MIKATEEVPEQQGAGGRHAQYRLQRTAVPPGAPALQQEAETREAVVWNQGRGGSAGTHTHGFQLSPSPTQMMATPWKAGPAASSEHSSRSSTRLPGTLREGW